MAPIAAAAAAIALVVWTSDRRESAEPRPTAITVENVPEDIDANGQVDILDAFVLAKRIDRGMELQPDWDVNGDTRVDSLDVDAVARAAVSLDKEILQ